MVQRRARSAGINTRVGFHTFRATGVTAYGGTLEKAAQMTNHASTPSRTLRMSAMIVPSIVPIPGAGGGVFLLTRSQRRAGNRRRCHLRKDNGRE
jgi:hypothetical protein